jgi:protein TonB
MFEFLSSPRSAIAAPSARLSAPAMRWPWLAGSLALHLLLAALVIGLASRSRLEAPAAALEVDLVEAPAPAAAGEAALPAAPLPDAAPPEPFPLPAPLDVTAAEPQPDPLPVAEPPPPTVVTAIPPPPDALAPPEPPPPPSAEPPAAPPPRPAAAPSPRPAPARATPQRQQPRATPSAQAAAAPPQAAAAPYAAQSAGPAVAAAPRADWDQLVSAWLAAHRSYPDAARRRGETGAVTLRISVAGDGRVTAVTVVDASGARDLTEAAVALLSGATLPPPGAPLARTVRIRYRLED